MPYKSASAPSNPKSKRRTGKSFYSSTKYTAGLQPIATTPMPMHHSNSNSHFRAAKSCASARRRRKNCDVHLAPISDLNADSILSKSKRHRPKRRCASSNTALSINMPSTITSTILPNRFARRFDSRNDISRSDRCPIKPYRYSIAQEACASVLERRRLTPNTSRESSR